MYNALQGLVGRGRAQDLGRAQDGKHDAVAARRLRVLEPGYTLATVRTAATTVGLTLTTGDDWELFWSYRPPWDNETLKRRLQHTTLGLARDPPRLVVNHVPGTLPLASKAHLPTFVRAAGLSAVLPESYLLPEDSAALEHRLATAGVNDGRGWPRWLFKAKNHRGVRVLTDGSAGALAKNSPAIVQQLVKPLLLRRLRRAFDIGLYVLISSVHPLRVYAYDRALVRFCEREYPTAPDGYAHDLRSYVISHYTPIWTLPIFAESLRKCNDSAACALRAELNAEGHDADKLWRRMRSTAGRLLTALQPHMASAMASRGLGNESTFELFRFDFMVNEAAEPVLTEVNISPNLVPASTQDGARALGMGTAAGFFGITYQGASNGLASLTLSIFNVDHPDDRAWLKHVFDFVAPNGELTREKVPDLLTFFYRNRPAGPTLSGTTLHAYPESEKDFLLALYPPDPSATVSFMALMDALQDAQANFAEPAAPLEYGSALVLRSDKMKHTRCVQHPQQQFRKPMTTSQEVGWELYSMPAGMPEAPPAGNPFHLRTSATTQFADAMEKQTWGRSIGGEFSAYAMRKLVEFGGQGMGV